VIIEQGVFESWFGLHTLKIENSGQQGRVNSSHFFSNFMNSSGADMRIQAISSPKVFKRLLLRAATIKRNGLALTQEDVQSIISNNSPIPLSNIRDKRPEIQSGPSQEKFEQLNSTMTRIEQLLTLQLQLQQQIQQKS